MLERLLAGVQPREAQQIADETFHPHRVTADDLEESSDLRRLGTAVEQRLDVAADGGQRRAQLVRDVGDEVTADAIGTPQIGDVVHDEHGAGGAWRHDRRGARDDDEFRLVRQRQLDALRRASCAAPLPSCAAMSGSRTISSSGVPRAPPAAAASVAPRRSRAARVRDR